MRLPRRSKSAAGAGHEDLVKRANLDSAVSGRAVTLRSQGVGIVAVVAAIRFLPV